MNPIARDVAARIHAAAPSIAVDDIERHLTAPPRPEMGDYAFGCFSLAKAERKAPPAIAAALASRIEVGGYVASVEAAGPYVNVRLDRTRTFAWLLARTADERSPWFGGDDAVGRTLCIDYSSPNIAKHLAYHHIRSTMIGHALVNLYRAVGWRVIGINHLGDWGTTFGKLIVAMKRFGEGVDLSEDAVTKLNDLYVRFNREAAADPSLEDDARAWFKRLEDHDPEARELWGRFREASLAEFERIYRRLGVTFEEVKGEADFHDDTDAVVARLDAKGLLSESDGATVVDLSDEGLIPCLIRKSDGATLYATRDVAAALHRQETYGFDRMIYVVDSTQTLHFKQLFAVLRRLGMPGADACHHVPFGFIKMGGKKGRSREGTIRLNEVLDEAVAAIDAKIAEINPELESRDEVSEQVGVGAVVFADLVAQRTRDYDFDWDRVLDFEGHSGPYVQYAHARASSVLRKAAAASADVDPSRLTLEEEWAVARAIEAFPAKLRAAVEADEPSIVTNALLDLAGAYSRWYNVGNRDHAARILAADEAVTAARVALDGAVARTLCEGLALIGLKAPATM